LLLKVTIVFSLAAPVSALLRGRSAAARHLVWTLALLAAVVLAPLTLLAPRLPVSLPATAARGLPALIVPPPTRAPEVGQGPSATEWNAADARGSIAPRSDRPRRSPVPTLALFWLAGSLGVLLWSAFGHLGLWGLHRSSLPVERDAWARLFGIEPPVHGAAACGSPTVPSSGRRSPGASSDPSCSCPHAPRRGRSSGGVQPSGTSWRTWSAGTM